MNRGFDFLELYEEHYGKLVLYLRNYTQNNELIEDAIQDTFLKLWKNRKKIVISGSVRAYLYRSAHNNLMDTFNEETKHRKMLDQYIHTAFMCYENMDADYKEQLMKKLEDCVDLLPDKCKEVFVCVKLKQMKYKETAEHIKVSQKTVEGHIRRAYFFIKNCVNPIC